MGAADGFIGATTKIVDHGPNSDRWNLVILGDGYRVSEIPQYHADVQKFVTLKLQRGLITDGMFKYVRHPNYLGEMMIYGSLALLAWHWVPVLVLAYYWGTMFATNMVMKEASMSRYPEWAAYKKRSRWLVPGVF